MLLQDLQKLFNVSLAQVLFVGSVATGERMTLGPIVALIVDKLGFKLSTSLGAIICASAMAGCLLLQDFTSFKIFYGFVTDLQCTFFRMKRNFEKKQKNIAREYSMERKEGENSFDRATFACPHSTTQVPNEKLK